MVNTKPSNSYCSTGVSGKLHRSTQSILHHTQPRQSPATCLGEISEPCCMSAPRENHRVLANVNGLDGPLPRHPLPDSMSGCEPLAMNTSSVPSSLGCGCCCWRCCSIVHSYGLKRPMRKRTRLTARKPKTMESHTSSESGLLKEKMPPCCLSGFLIMMDVPVSM